MKGTFYSVGIGPGDPELLTLKSVRYITKCPVLAVPQGREGMTIARDILQQAAEQTGTMGLDKKEILTIHVPMTRDETVLSEAQTKAARDVEAYLEQGKDVVLIVLGCPTVYASSIYIRRLIAAHGYRTEIVPGITSFCAAAAALQQPLCEKDDPFIVIPGNRKDRSELWKLPGNAVIMKPAGTLASLKEDLEKDDFLKDASMVERCGLAGERVYQHLFDAEDTGYFSIILVHKQGE